MAKKQAQGLSKKSAIKKPATKAVGRSGVKLGAKAPAAKTLKSAPAARKKAAIKKPVAKKASALKPVAKKTAIKKVTSKLVKKVSGLKKTSTTPRAKPSKAPSTKSTKGAGKKPLPSGAAKSKKPAVKVARAPTKPARKPQPQSPKKPAIVPAATKAQDKAQDKAPAKTKGRYFSVGEYIMYPSHGVGRITAFEKRTIGHDTLEFLVVNFEQDKMVIRVPLAKVETVGLRKLSTDNIVKEALKVLKSPARIKRTMWSRRAQEYEGKIYSGNLVSMIEVVRDLYRAGHQNEPSYSEHQLFEMAMSRVCYELSIIEKCSQAQICERLEGILRQKTRPARVAGSPPKATVKSSEVQATA